MPFLIYFVLRSLLIPVSIAAARSGRAGARAAGARAAAAAAAAAAGSPSKTLHPPVPPQARRTRTRTDAAAADDPVRAGGRLREHQRARLGHVPVRRPLRVQPEVAGGFPSLRLDQLPPHDGVHSGWPLRAVDPSDHRHSS